MEIEEGSEGLGGVAGSVGVEEVVESGNCSVSAVYTSGLRISCSISLDEFSFFYYLATCMLNKIF